MHWSVPPRLWAGETCVCIAGGPSLIGFDDTLLRESRPRVIAINDSWRLCPWADIVYFCDFPWFRDQCGVNRKSIDGSTTFHDLRAEGFLVTAAPELASDPNVHYLALTGQLGFDADPACLRHGSNSGYQAIHLAAHCGASRIVLLGYDMHVSGTRSHWHKEKRSAAASFAGTIQRNFLPCFPTLVDPLRERGIEVLNATPGSALTCWPMVMLEDALQAHLTT